VRRRYDAIVLVLVFGVLCPGVVAQQDPAVPETDRENLDKLEIVWPDEPAEEPVAEQEPPVGRPLLQIDVPESIAPVGKEPSIADQPVPEDTTSQNLAELVRQLRDEVDELRREVEHIRTAVGLLSDRLDRLSVRTPAQPAGERHAQAGFYPFWLPHR